MSHAELLCGDCLEVLKTLPAASVQTCVTSPPYFGLRSYIADGHEDKPLEIGLEETPELFVAKLVEVFREAKRVLHPTGTIWVNLGDSYNGSGTMGSMDSKQGTNVGSHAKPATRVSGLKPKDLIGIPWMVAFALRADGWWLRSDIIWAKKNCMPESVTDRPTKAHEYIFLLSKSASYYYDSEAIAEQSAENTGWARERANGVNTWKYNDTPERIAQTGQRIEGSTLGAIGKRNKRSVWTVATQPYDGAHFATFPTALIEPCILAGTSAKGCCAQCGAPWERVVEVTKPPLRKVHSNGPVGGHGLSGGNRFDEPIKTTTLGWQPTCECVEAPEKLYWCPNSRHPLRYIRTNTWLSYMW